MSIRSGKGHFGCRMIHLMDIAECTGNPPYSVPPYSHRWPCAAERGESKVLACAEFYVPRGPRSPTCAVVIVLDWFGMRRCTRVPC